MMSGLKYNTKNPVQAAIMQQSIVSALRPEAYQKVLETTDAVSIMSVTLDSIATMAPEEQVISIKMLEDHFNLNEQHSGPKSDAPFETIAKLILADMAFALALALGQVEDADIFSCNNMSVPDWALCAECLGIGSTVGTSLMATWNWQRQTFSNIPQFLELATVHSASAPYWARILDTLGIAGNEEGGRAQGSDDPLLTTPIETLIGMLHGTEATSGLGEYMTRVPSLIYTDSARRIPSTTPITFYTKPPSEMHILFNDCLRARGFQTVFITPSEGDDDKDDADYATATSHNILETFSHKRFNRRELAVQVLINRDAIVIVPVGENFNLKVSLKSAWKPQCNPAWRTDSQGSDDEEVLHAQGSIRAKDKKSSAPVESSNTKRPGVSGRHPASAASAPTPSSRQDQIDDYTDDKQKKKSPAEVNPRRPPTNILGSLKKSVTSAARRYSDEEGGSDHDSQISGDECAENKVVSLAREERKLRELMGLKKGVNIDEYHDEEGDLMDDDLTEKELRQLDSIDSPVQRKLWLEKQKILKEAKLAKSEGRNPRHLEVVRPPTNSKDKQTKIAFSTREVRTEPTTSRDKMDTPKKPKDTSPSPAPAKQGKSFMDRLVSHQKQKVAREEEEEDHRSSGPGIRLSSLVKKKREREESRRAYDSEEDDGDECGSADDISDDEGTRPSASKRRRLDDDDDDDEDVYMSDGESGEASHEGGHQEEEAPPTYYFRMSNNCTAKPSELFHAFHAAITALDSKYTKIPAIDSNDLKDRWEDTLASNAKMHKFFSEDIHGRDAPIEELPVFKFFMALFQPMPSKEVVEAENWVDLFEEKLYFRPKCSKDHLDAMMACFLSVRSSLTASEKEQLDTVANVWRREKTQKDFFDLIMRTEEIAEILQLLTIA